jgi:hypothetical protein
VAFPCDVGGGGGAAGVEAHEERQVSCQCGMLLREVVAQMGWRVACWYPSEVLRLRLCGRGVGGV